MTASLHGTEPCQRESCRHGHQQSRGKSSEPGELGLSFLRHHSMAQVLVHGPQVFGRVGVEILGASHASNLLECLLVELDSYAPATKADDRPLRGP